MFEKQKQHIRILKQLRKIRKQKQAFEKGSPEYIHYENKYERNKERYFPILITNYKKGTKIGFKFLLKQTGLAIFGFAIRRTIQYIVPPICICLGFQYFEKPKPAKNPCDPIELQALRNDTNSLKNELMALKEQMECQKAMHNASPQNRENATPQSPSYFTKDNRDEIAFPKTQELKKNEQPSMKSEPPAERNNLEFKPVGSGVTRVGHNRFAWKFSPRNNGRTC